MAQEAIEDVFETASKMEQSVERIIEGLQDRDRYISGFRLALAQTNTLDELQELKSTFLQ